MYGIKGLIIRKRKGLSVSPLQKTHIGVKIVNLNPGDSVRPALEFRINNNFFNNFLIS